VIATGDIRASSSPGNFGASIRAQAACWAPVIKQTGIKPD